jgi:DNA-binding IclR family transcriptional regulator
LGKGFTSVTEIADTLKIHKSTVYRLLQALGEAGFTLRNPLNRRYYIGPLIAEIAANPNVTHQTLVSCSLSEMELLSKLTGESIGLNVLIGLRIFLLHEIPSTYDLRIVARNRISTNVYAGANAKVLLSQLNKRELKIVTNNSRFEPMTEQTITNKDELLAQLDAIREQGYAIGHAERVPGAASIAVPIRDYILPASLGILGPENRVQPRTGEFVDALIEASTRIHHKLLQISKM